MVKVKLTKTELKAQTDALKRFQRFLPMLQLKKQQLQAEIAAIVAKAEAVAARERELRAAMNAWIGVVATEEGLLSGLVKVGEVKTGRANIAGVEIPTFESAETEVGRIDRWATPPWVDDSVEAAKEVVSLRYVRAVFEEPLRKSEDTRVQGGDPRHQDRPRRRADLIGHARQDRQEPRPGR